MKIISIRPQLISSNYGDNESFGQPLGVKSLGLVIVELDNGHFGIGESYSSIYLPELFSSTVESLSRYLTDLVFNDPRDVFNEFFIPFCSRSGFIQSVYSAIDIALWDAFLHAKKCTLPSYLGANLVDPLLYFSGGSAVCSPNAILEEASLIDSQYDGFKMRICRQPWDVDLQRIAAAKSCWHKPLMVDSIMGTLRPPMDLFAWSAGKLEDLTSLDVYWLEEPLQPDNLSELKALLEMKDRPKIALGESIVGKFELETTLSQPLDILQLDVTQCGGISLLLSLLPLINQFSEVAFHVWGSPVSFAANLQFSYLVNSLKWIEYPGVSLHLFKDCSPSFFSGPSDIFHYKYLTGFSTFELLNTVIHAPFVPNSGYRIP